MGKSVKPREYCVLHTKLFIAGFIIICISTPFHTMAGNLPIILNGSELARADHVKIQHACEFSRSGQETSWVNGSSGNRYSIIPQPAFIRQSSNQPCRKAGLKAISDNQTEQISILSCRSSNGNWIIQEISSPQVINQPHSVSPRKSRPTQPPSGHRWKKAN